MYFDELTISRSGAWLRLHSGHGPSARGRAARRCCRRSAPSSGVPVSRLASARLAGHCSGEIRYVSGWRIDGCHLARRHPRAERRATPRARTVHSSVGRSVHRGRSRTTATWLAQSSSGHCPPPISSWGTRSPATRISSTAWRSVRTAIPRLQAVSRGRYGCGMSAWIRGSSESAVWPTET
jgi:hypothetical protein